MSTQVMLSKASIIDESTSPLAAIRKINSEISVLEGLSSYIKRSYNELWMIEDLIKQLKVAKEKVEVENMDYLEIIKEFI